MIVDFLAWNMAGASSRCEGLGGTCLVWVGCLNLSLCNEPFPVVSASWMLVSNEAGWYGLDIVN